MVPRKKEQSGVIQRFNGSYCIKLNLTQQKMNKTH